MNLYIAYFYKQDGDKDACLFVADETKDLEKQFIKYTRRQEWNIDREDIDIYEVKTEEDCNGNKYLISINKK